MRSLLYKRAIAVHMDVSPTTDVIAGMPTSPVVVRNQGLRIPERVKKTEGGSVATALSESFRSVAGDLERKFGSNHPFVLGVLSELEKSGDVAGFFKGLMTKLRPAAKAAPVTAPQKIQVRSQTLKPSSLSAPSMRPAPVEEDPWSAFDRAIPKMDARRRRVL